MLPALYHAHHSLHLDDIPFWLKLADQTGGPVLELGCGTGRVLDPLSRAGYRVVGLDHDLAMLHFNRSGIDLHTRPLPLLLSADISRFRLAMQFPLIIMPCNTFSTLDEVHRLGCLKCVHMHLKPSGIFATSLPNPELLARLPANSPPEYEEQFTHPQTGNPVQVSSSWQRKQSAFTVTWNYDHLLPDGRVERFSTDITHHIISAEGYLDEIHQSGMKVKDVYGDYDRTVYTASSLYLIILASD